jgi:Anticodon binding domain
VLEPPPPRPTKAPETLERFKEVADGDPRTIIRELKAVGGDLRALRLALTGRDRGPELAAILAALPKEEALRRVDQALQHAHP